MFFGCSGKILAEFFWKAIVQDSFSPGKHHKEGQKGFCSKSQAKSVDDATFCNMQHPSPKYANTF